MTRFIPSFFTSLNIACGFFAICVHDIKIGGICILTCIFLDTLDGLAARVFNAQSEMGKELDSLADLVSFGIAPAYLYFSLAPFDHWSKFLPALAIVLGSALRLAKFNTIPSLKYFIGMPTPTPAFFMAGLFFAIHYENPTVVGLMGQTWFYSLIPLVFMGLMLSNLKMFSIKELHLGVSKNKYQLITFLSFLALLFVDIKTAIPLSVIVYILLSIVRNLRYKDDF